MKGLRFHNLAESFYHNLNKNLKLGEIFYNMLSSLPLIEPSGNIIIFWNIIRIITSCF
jgi:hypothetical protein